MQAQRIATLAIYVLVVMTMWNPSKELGPAAELFRYAVFLGASALVILHAHLARGLAISLSVDWVLLIAFLAYTCLSFLWSDGGVNAFIKAMLIFSAMLVTISMARTKHLDETLLIFHRCLSGFVVLSILAVFLFPDIGIETGWELVGDWRGIAGQKNGLGYMAALAFVATLALPVDRNRANFARAALARLAMVLISGACLVNSGSRGALMIAGIGVGSVLVARAPGVVQRVILVMFVAFIVPFVNLTLPTLELTADQIGVLGTTIDTSNRTTLWFFGLDQLAAKGRLDFGFGVGGFWTPERLTQFRDTYGWVLDNFHNGYITILIEGGFVGLALLLGAIASILLLFFVSISGVKDPFLGLAFGYVNMFLFGNLVENEIGRSTSTTFILFLAISFSLRIYVTGLLRAAKVSPARQMPVQLARS